MGRLKHFFMGMHKTIGIIDSLSNTLKPYLEEESGKVTEKTLNNKIKINFTGDKNSKKLHILIPGWGGKISYCKNICAMEVLNGNSFLTYEVPTGILSSDIELTKKCFEIYERRVIRDIDKITKEYMIKELYFTGVSLGCVSVPRIIKKLEERKQKGNKKKIKRVTFVVPGDCLAESLWFGIRTKHFRREFEEKGISLKQLKEEWKLLAPKENIGKLKKTKVVIYLSKSDRVIPYYCGKKLIKRMKKENIKPKIYINKFLGHYGTGFHFFKNPSHFLRD